jgi:restriction system protein
MSENSIFAMLLRSPWWISIAVAAAIFAAGRLAMPEEYAAFVALPFTVIGSYAAWQQFRAPSAQSVATSLEALRSVSWDAFSAAMEQAFRREGYAVTRISGAATDFELTKAGRVSLVSCKRWKVARAGIEPLRELHAAGLARDAHECIYVAAGEVTVNALAFAAANKIRLLRDAELAKLVRLASLRGTKQE